MTLQDAYRTLIAIRSAHPALRDGTVVPLLLDNTHRVFAFLRADSSDKVAVAINDGASVRTVTLRPSWPAGTKLSDALSGRTYVVSGGKVAVAVPATGAAVLVPSHA